LRRSLFKLVKNASQERLFELQNLLHLGHLKNIW
jgi:hypothetical protein